MYERVSRPEVRWTALNYTSRAPTRKKRFIQLIFRSFTPHLIPPSPLPPSSPDCPLVTDLSSAHPHLVSLLSETATHLSSSDSRYLLDKGVSAMLIKLRDELYRSPGEGQRMVDCLPMVDRWGKGVWEGLPDSGVEVCSTPWPDREEANALGTDRRYWRCLSLRGLLHWSLEIGHLEIEVMAHFNISWNSEYAVIGARNPDHGTSHIAIENALLKARRRGYWFWAISENAMFSKRLNAAGDARNAR